MNVGLEASEEASHSSEYVIECVLASGNILSCLRDLGVEIRYDEEWRYSPRGGRQLQRRPLFRVGMPKKKSDDRSPTSSIELLETYRARNLAKGGRKLI